MIKSLLSKITSARNLISSLKGEKANLQNELENLKKEMRSSSQSKESLGTLYHQLMSANTLISSLASEKIMLSRKISAEEKREIGQSEELLEMELSFSHATIVFLRSEKTILQKQIEAVRKGKHDITFEQVVELKDEFQQIPRKKENKTAASTAIDKDKDTYQSKKLIELLKKEIISAHGTVSSLKSEKIILENQLFASRELKNIIEAPDIDNDNEDDLEDHQQQRRKMDVNKSNCASFPGKENIVNNLLDEQRNEIQELREDVTKSFNTTKYLNDMVSDVATLLQHMERKNSLMENFLKEAVEDGKSVRNIYSQMMLDRDETLSNLRNDINTISSRVKSIKDDIEMKNQELEKYMGKSILIDEKLHRTIKKIKCYESKKGTKRSQLLLSFRRVCTSNRNTVIEAREILNKQLLISSSHHGTRGDKAIFFEGEYTPIEGVHNRAISLHQLGEIWNYIESHVIDDKTGKLSWKDRNPKSPTYGEHLTLKTINLYHLTEFFFSKVTLENKCSIVELLAKGEQLSDWFVSHAWKMPMYEMVTSLKNHAQVRGLDPEHTYYWICGFANRQHNIGEGTLANPLESSFVKALQMSKGIVLCLDTSGTPFERTWCCFEQVLAQQIGKSDRHLLLDITTVENEEPVVITDGRSAPVVADMSFGPECMLELKRVRELKFPLSLLEQGYQIDINATQTTLKNDQQQILRSLREIYSYESFNDGNMTFERVNVILRGIIAEAAARKAADERRLDHAIRVLRQDTERTKLTLNLGGCSHLDIAALAGIAGHPSLQELTIDCSYCHIVNMDKLGDAFVGLHRLKKLHLNFAWSTNFRKEDIMKLSIRGFAFLRSTLVELKITFKGCPFPIALPRIKEFKSLEKLFLDYSRTPTEIRDGTYFGGILKLKSLRTLHLQFEGCQNITHIRPLKDLVELQKLEILLLNFNYTNLENVNELSALLDMESISKCSISLLKCTQINTIPWLKKVFSEKAELKLDLRV